LQTIRNSHITSMAFFYKLALPVANIVCLLIISPQLDRSQFLDSTIFDWMARIWICATFCFGYLFLDKFGKTLQVPSNQKKQKVFIILRILRASFFGLFAVIITQWIVDVFLSPFSKFSLLIGIIHGLVLALPIGLPTNALINGD